MMRGVLLAGVLAVAGSAGAQEPPPAYPAPPSGYHPHHPYGPPRHLVPQAPLRPYRETRPSAVYGELGGKGLAYSVGFDYAIKHFIGVGASFSYLDPAVFLSPYLNLYPVGSARSALLVQAGVQIVNVDSKSNELLQELLWKEEGVDVGGQVSIGYEYRKGFLFRVALMGMFNRHGFMPWFGLTFGGSF